MIGEHSVVRSVARSLRPFLRSVKWEYVIGSIAALVAAQAEAAALLLAVRAALSMTQTDGSAFDLGGMQFSTLTTLVIALGCAAVAIALHLVLSRMVAQIGAKTMYDIRSDVVGSFGAASWSEQAVQREGALQEVVTTIADRVSWLAQALLLGIAHAAALASFVAMSFLVSPVGTGAAIAMGVVVVAIVAPISRLSERHSQRFVALNKAYGEDVGRMTSAAMDLKIFGVEDAAAAVLGTTSSEVREAQVRTRHYTVAAQLMYKDIVVLFFVFALALLAISGSNAILGMGVAVTLCARALVEAQQANSSYQTLVAEKANLDILVDEIERLRARRDRFGERVVDAIDTVTVRSVTYRYPDALDDEPPALRGVSFTARVGEAIALVGPSGGGKTTLAQVLLRLRVPTSGTVEINGFDAATIDARCWAEFVAAVAQEPSLIEGTIQDNISYYRHTTPAQVRQAAELAHVHADIERRPDGYQTTLGARGIGLSGGQKQRIAIARALVRKPQMIVMDEPSSALDVQAEQALVEAIDQIKQHSVVFIVAHREQTVQRCDRVIAIENGRATERGSRPSHASLTVG